jgi:hypothetical protein
LSAVPDPGFTCLAYTALKLVGEISNVRFWHKADIPHRVSNVRFWG